LHSSTLFPYTTLFRSQPGKLLRMKGKGIIGLNSKVAGDQFVEVNVYIPTNLTDAERKQVEDLKGAKNFDPASRSDQKKDFFSKRSEEHTSELQSRENL